MSERGFSLFSTAIGACGVAWNERGIVGLQLPEADDAATRARMRKRFPGHEERRVPRAVKTAIASIERLLSGRHVDLAEVPLDMDGIPDFHRRVYHAARSIPPGQTRTYGELAAHAGSPSAARAVGQAMRRNPFPIVVPCHRVMAAGGRTGGFTAPGGVDTKLKILAIEGADVAATRKAAPPSGTAAKRPARHTRSEAPTPADGTDARAALRHLRSADAVLGRHIDGVGPYRLEIDETSSVFGALSEAIVYQQLTGKAAATIYGRVVALFPGAKKGLRPDHILAAREDDLRGAGLSRAKVAALRDLAEKTADGTLPTLARVRRMHDDEIVESLTQVRGIGRWTVEMLLMFRLGRPDVLPADDYGVKKGFSIVYRRKELPTAKELLAHGERWRPFRSVASWYLWRATDAAKS